MTRHELKKWIDGEIDALNTLFKMFEIDAVVCCTRNEKHPDFPFRIHYLYTTENDDWKKEPEYFQMLPELKKRVNAIVSKKSCPVD